MSKIIQLEPELRPMDKVDVMVSGNSRWDWNAVGHKRKTQTSSVQLVCFYKVNMFEFILKSILVPAVIQKITFLALSNIYKKKEFFSYWLVVSTFLLLWLKKKKTKKNTPPEN